MSRTEDTVHNVKVDERVDSLYDNSLAARGELLLLAPTVH